MATLGYTGTGTSDHGGNKTLMPLSKTPVVTEPGIVTKFWARLKNNGALTWDELGIYDALTMSPITNGHKGNLGITLPGASFQWLSYTFPANNQPSICMGKSYYLGVATDYHNPPYTTVQLVRFRVNTDMGGIAYESDGDFNKTISLKYYNVNPLTKDRQASIYLEYVPYTVLKWRTVDKSNISKINGIDINNIDKLYGINI